MQAPAELPAHEWRPPKPAASKPTAAIEVPVPVPVKAKAKASGGKKKVRRVARAEVPETEPVAEDGAAAQARPGEGASGGTVEREASDVAAASESGAVARASREAAPSEAASKSSDVARASGGVGQGEASNVAAASKSGPVARASGVSASVSGEVARASGVSASGSGEVARASGVSASGSGEVVRASGVSASVSGEAARASGGANAVGEVEGARADGEDVEAEGPARCQLDVSPEGDPARWRRGRAQMFAGAGFLGVGVVGLGVMVSGWYVQRFSANELSRGTGYSEEALAPLRAQQDRGETMLAAGAVTAVFGAALGATLLATGARDVRAGRAARWSSVRVAPSLGGLVLSGRF